MPLKNYTTSIAAEKTMGEIQTMLARAGARRITVDYSTRREPSGVEFTVDTQHGERYFMLPARIEAIHATLRRQNSSGQVAARFTTREQAARVGWRIIRDWLDAQLAIVESEMVSIEEIFLPYMLIDGQRSVFELYEGQRFTALPPGREGAQ
jgi:hypothetical protein